MCFIENFPALSGFLFKNLKRPKGFWNALNKENMCIKWIFRRIFRKAWWMI